MVLHRLLAAGLAFGLCLLPAGDGRASGEMSLPPAGCAFEPFSDADPEYYRIDLVPTRNVPGTYQAFGVGRISFASSPFSVSVTPGGHYVHELEVQVNHLQSAPKGTYVAWVSTPALDKVKRLGPLGEDRHLAGTVNWNKFLVIITLEAEPGEATKRWRGPVVLRGLSRSGLMHTMAGHGPFANEPCAKYGY